jgi:hypothetical protein
MSLPVNNRKFRDFFSLKLNQQNHAGTRTSFLGFHLPPQHPGARSPPHNKTSIRRQEQSPAQ